MNFFISKQQVFDKVVAHLRAQGQKSVSETTNRCLYRGPNNLKCAAGCLIDDEDYHPKMEANAFGPDFLDKFKYARSVQILKDHQDLVRQLQVIHDNHDPKNWERLLQSLAGTYNLLYTPAV